MNIMCVTTPQLHQAVKVMGGLQAKYPLYTFSIRTTNSGSTVEMEKTDQSEKVIYGIQCFAEGYWIAVVVHGSGIDYSKV